MSVKSLPKRSATFVLESLGNALWGFKPNLMAHFVEQRGALGGVAWFVNHMPKYERILKTWGPIRTHLISTALSTLNGCPYCTHGHAYAFQLHYLNDYQALFPLTETEIIELYQLTEEELISRFDAALIEANLSEEIPYLNRMIELRRDGSLASTKEDNDSLHLIKMFAALNECGIRSQAKIDAAHDPINRNTALRRRYAALRSEQRQPGEALS